MPPGLQADRPAQTAAPGSELSLSAGAWRAASYLLEQSSTILSALGAGKLAPERQPDAQQRPAEGLAALNLADLPGAARFAESLSGLGHYISKAFNLGPLWQALRCGAADPGREEEIKAKLQSVGGPELQKAFDRIMDGMRRGDRGEVHEGWRDLRRILHEADPKKRAEILQALHECAECVHDKRLKGLLQDELQRISKELLRARSASRAERPAEAVLRESTAPPEALLRSGDAEAVWLTRLHAGERSEEPALARVCREMGEAARRSGEEQKREREEREGEEQLRQHRREVVLQAAAALGPEALQTEAVRAAQERSLAQRPFENRAFAELEDSGVAQEAARELGERRTRMRRTAPARNA